MKWLHFLLVLLTFHSAADAQASDTLIIHFNFNKSDINGEAMVVIDSFLRANDQFTFQQIKLYGHCDLIGSNNYNDSLSLERVIATKNYLMVKGIPATAFIYEKGYGKRRPLNKLTSDEASALNRRVQIIFDDQAPINKEIKKKDPAPVEAKPLADILKDTATKVGSNLILHNLNFEGGRHLLLPESYAALEELLKAMQQNSSLVIEIQGYVCCTPDNQDNYDIDLHTNDLSLQRAKTIYDYLTSKNINASRMSYRGMGGSFKIFPLERDEMERSQNRRVEIKIIQK